jgi:transketolase
MSDLKLTDINGTLEMQPTRAGFGSGLKLAGERDTNVVALCADLTGSVKMDGFATAFPDRFVQIGVAEQNLATVAAGLALAGKIPFIASYAAFSPGRNWEQIKTTAAINDVPVKVIGGHAGLYTGADGATH